MNKLEKRNAFRNALKCDGLNPVDIEIQTCNIFMMHYQGYKWEDVMSMPEPRFQIMAEDLCEFLKAQTKTNSDPGELPQTFGGQ